MDTLGALLARDRRTDDLAVRAPGAGDATAEYTYEDFVTTAWKTANFFSHRGVHREATVAVADDAAVPPLLALFGAAQLGAATLFDPPPSVDADLLVAPGDGIMGYDLPPGATRVAYHDQPEDPAVAAFGRSVWSENPVEPPESVDPASPVLHTDDDTVTHEALLERAEVVAADLSGDDEVVVRAPLARPGTVVAGVLAPLLAGAAIVFPDEEDGTRGDVAVATGQAPEDAVVSPDDV
jgi:hypothetical protein